MDKEKYYIYKFIDEKENVLYVGKTKNLESRLKDHIRDKKWLMPGVRFYFAKTVNPTDMDIYETYYINKLNPRYNEFKKYGSEFTQEIDELRFDLHKELKDTDFVRERKNSYTNTIIGCGTEDDRMLEHSGLPVHQDIYVQEDIVLNMMELMSDTDIIESYRTAYSLLDDRDRAFSFKFKMVNGGFIEISLIYNPETFLDIPRWVYYDHFLPLLKERMKHPNENNSYLFKLDELHKEGDMY